MAACSDDNTASYTEVLIYFLPANSNAILNRHAKLDTISSKKHIAYLKVQHNKAKNFPIIFFAEPRFRNNSVSLEHGMCPVLGGYLMSNGV